PIPGVPTEPLVAPADPAVDFHHKDRWHKIEPVGGRSRIGLLINKDVKIDACLLDKSASCLHIVLGNSQDFPRAKPVNLLNVGDHKLAGGTFRMEEDQDHRPMAKFFLQTPQSTVKTL